jgi:hypothetical protein
LPVSPYVLAFWMLLLPHCNPVRLTTTDNWAHLLEFPFWYGTFLTEALLQHGGISYNEPRHASQSQNRNRLHVIAVAWVKAHRFGGAYRVPRKACTSKIDPTIMSTIWM